MKQSLSLRQNQQLRVSQQLQQAIRLLQLSSIELAQVIQTNCESNALLEWDDVGGDEEDLNFDEPLADPDVPSENDEWLGDEPDDAESTNMSLELNSLSEALNEDPSVELSSVENNSEIEWSDLYIGEERSSNTDNIRAYELQSNPDTLTDHLMEQVRLSDLTPEQKSLAQYIVDNLNEDGYLQSSAIELVDDLPPAIQADLETFESVLKVIQTMSPAGVGARDVRECLRIQLQEEQDSNPICKLAMCLVDDCLEALASSDYAAMERVTQAEHEDLVAAVELIRSLNPRPGASFCETNTTYVVPDVLVRKIKGEWTVELNDDVTSAVRISSHYKHVMNQMRPGNQKSFLLNQFREARTFLQGLQHRQSTLLKTASAIVAEQTAFFDSGDSAMRPLLKSEIARTLGVHESTISRITTQKYLESPRGTFELSYFFSSHVQSSRGNEVSSRAIKAIIRKLTDEENPAHPMSDSAITSALRERDIRIARRTVTKYRESMAIPSSRERQIGSWK